MKDKNHTDGIIEQVPPDYYQKGVENNFFQRTWHKGKLHAVLGFVSRKPHKILDVGCASGWFLSQVRNNYPRSQCYGVDIYKEGILYGKKKYPYLKLKVCNAHDLTYKDKTFDLVISTEVLEHVEKPEKVLKEIRRVLKDDGQLIIELDSGSILFSITWYLWRLSNGKVWNHSHLHSFNIKKLDKILRKTGFKILNKKRFNLGMAMVFVAQKA